MPNILKSVAPIKDTLTSLWLRYKIHRLRRSYQKPQALPSKHLVLLAWQFPPTITGGVYRPLSIVQAAAEAGWQVTVICGPSPREISPAGSHLLERLPPSVRVLRMTESKLRPSYRLGTQVDGGFETALETVLTTIAVSDFHPSVFFASGPPFQSFIAARYLAAHYAAPLVIDYRDEWTDCPFGFVQRGNRDRVWEWLCLKSANLVIYTTKSFLIKALLSFPKLDAAKCRVYPNGFDPMDAPAKRLNSGSANNQIIISFLGNLSFHTSPDSFLDGLARASEMRPELRDRINLRFFGHMHPAIVKRLDEHPLSFMIERFEHIPKPKAIGEMHCSTALLLLNPPDLNRYIPGKLFDYISSGTPILVYGKGGETADAVEYTGTGIVVDENEPRELASALLHLAGVRSATSGRQRAWLARHNRKVIADELLDELSSLAEGY